MSYDSKQWSVARDLYLQCVEEDPGYAPAWARLGRIHHLMGKYLPAGTQESLDLAEAAFRRALDLNPDLTLAHKLFAQLDVDLGRAHDAMIRLIARAHTTDPELLAGLVSACRYCGLLHASVAAHARAAGLEPKIRTSVPHTWFLQGDHARVATMSIADFPYIVALSQAELGRGAEALPVLRELEQKIPTRMHDFIVAARALIDGDATESVAAIGRVTASDFRDPEALFYLSRHLAHLGEPDAAITLLERVIGGGFFCFPALERDPWLDPLRSRPAFQTLLLRAETLHRAAAAAFANLRGHQVLGVAADLTAAPGIESSR